MKFSSFLVPIAFLILTFILLSIPGNQFPKAKMFQIPGLDKVIHVGMFFQLTFLFCHPFKNAPLGQQKKKTYFFQIALFAFLYGILMEFVQKYFVANRSFELADIFVDGIGVLLGYLLSRRYLIRAVYINK